MPLKHLTIQPGSRVGLTIKDEGGNVIFEGVISEPELVFEKKRRTIFSRRIVGNLLAIKFLVSKK